MSKLKTWTVIAGPGGGDIWADHIEAPSAKDAMLVVIRSNGDYVLTDIIAVIEGEHQVIAPADLFEGVELDRAELLAAVPNDWRDRYDDPDGEGCEAFNDTKEVLP